MTHDEAVQAYKLSYRVQKVSGYKWPGVIVAIFCNHSGQLRCVVECDAPEVEGALHIYNLGQIQRIEGGIDENHSNSAP